MQNIPLVSGYHNYHTCDTISYPETKRNYLNTMRLIQLTGIDTNNNDTNTMNNCKSSRTITLPSGHYRFVHDNSESCY